MYGTIQISEKLLILYRCAAETLAAFDQASCFLPQIRAGMCLFMVPGGRGAMEELSPFASHRLCQRIDDFYRFPIVFESPGVADRSRK